MLVLSRKYGDITKIGDFMIKIVKHDKVSGQIKLIIDAPSHIKIDRLDILNKREDEHERKESSTK